MEWLRVIALLLALVATFILSFIHGYDIAHQERKQKHNGME